MSGFSVRRRRPSPPSNSSPARRRRLLALAAAACAAVAATALPGPAAALGEQAPPQSAQAQSTKAADGRLVGYFANWDVYQRDYHVKDIDASGSAA